MDTLLGGTLRGIQYFTVEADLTSPRLTRPAHTVLASRKSQESPWR